MPAPIINKHRDLDDLCDRLAAAELIGFDTEFVSEHTYHPQLCLVQLITPTESAVVDPQSVDVLPLWKVISQGEHTTVFHAGREELNFLLRAVGAVPKKFFDVQIAAGLCSKEFPAAYGSLVGRVLGRQLVKGEQRTDWRRRPLTDAQVQYALEDVRHLLPLYERLSDELRRRNRLSWLEEELQLWSADIVSAQERKDWRRVSGIGALSPRSLAVVRELWHWRQDAARELNQPPKRVLRDDLLVEIAKRKISEPNQILAIRGLERSHLKRSARELAECVRRGLEAPLERSSRGPTREPPPQLGLLGQFLTPALTTICRRADVAAALVGAASDVRELIAMRFGFGESDAENPPTLLRGWRAELVGNLLDDLLAGRKSIRIANAFDEDPLAFDDVAPAPNGGP